MVFDHKRCPGIWKCDLGRKNTYRLIPKLPFSISHLCSNLSGPNTSKFKTYLPHAGNINILSVNTDDYLLKKIQLAFSLM